MSHSSSNFYESDRAVSEYLLFHFGSAEEILPYEFGPTNALEYPQRCVAECLDISALPESPRALDLGCSVGRSSFELGRHCTDVVGIDFSHRFIAVAEHLCQQGAMTFAYVDEGALTKTTTAMVPPDIDRKRLRFRQGDAQKLPSDLGRFDVVLMANLIDRLPSPEACLDQLPGLIAPKGQLIITSPYTWLEEYTPRSHWLGGYQEGDQTIRTLDRLQSKLQNHFELDTTKDLPFLIREHARKFQWSVAQASIWIRKD